MTVSSNDPRKSYVGNNVTTNFNTPQFSAQTDLVVYLGSSLQVNGTDYNIVSITPGYFGVCQFVNPPGPGTIITIINNTPILQNTNWVANDADPSEVKEAAFDKLTLITQRLSDRLDRSLTLSDSSVGDDVDTELPSPEASNVIGWNADADGLVNYPLSVISDGLVTEGSLGYDPAWPFELSSVTYISGYAFGCSSIVDQEGNTRLTNGTTVRIHLTESDDWLTGIIINKSGNTVYLGDVCDSDGTAAVLSAQTIRAWLGSGLGRDLYPVLDGEVGVVNTKYPTGDVRRYGAKGDGVTDDTAALKAAVAANNNLYWPEGTYLVDTVNNALVPTSKTTMHWRGYGATIKAKDGATAAGNALILRLLNCSNVLLEGITFDGNRANRSAFNSSSHCIQINDGDNITFRDVYVINSTYDGIYVRGTNQAVESTYPTRILLDNVWVDNAYRNGLSIVGANGVEIRGGGFENTNGTAPQAGIDIEPNPSDTYSVQNVLIEGTNFENNVGTGISLHGNVGLLSKNIRLKNISGRNNGECLILVAYTDDVIIDGVTVNGDTTIPTESGIITIQNKAGNVMLNNISFQDVTGVTATKALIYVEDTATSPRYINNVRASNVSCQVIYGRASNTYIDGVQIDTDTSTESSIYLAAGSYNSLKNVSILNKASSAGVRVQSTFSEIESITLHNVTNGVRMQGTNNKYRNITVMHSGTATGYGCYLDTVTGVSIQNVHISDVGGFWTNANAFNVSAVASLAGATFRDCSPSPLIGSATWDPASIAAGAQATTTVAVTRADIGDFVMVKHSITLGGLQSFAYVSAANTVTVGLSNNSGGAIDLASHTVTVEVIK